MFRYWIFHFITSFYIFFHSLEKYFVKSYISHNAQLCDVPAKRGFGRQPHSGCCAMLHVVTYIGNHVFYAESPFIAELRVVTSEISWSEATWNFVTTLYYANIVLVSYCILYIMRSAIIFICWLWPLLSYHKINEFKKNFTKK